MDFAQLSALLEELLRFLNQHGGRSVEIQKGLIADLRQTIAGGADDGAKASEALRRFKQLYPPRGGLSDFYVWIDDLEQRKKINQEFDRIGNQIWDMLKNLDG